MELTHTAKMPDGRLVDVLPVSRAERVGLELQRIKLQKLGYSDSKTRTDVTWTWHGNQLHSVMVSQRILLEQEP